MTDAAVWFEGLYVRLGDGSMLFDPVSWETHLLNPSATTLAEAIFERFSETRPSVEIVEEMVRDEFNWDAASPSFVQTMHVLCNAQLVAADSSRFRAKYVDR